MEPLVKICGLTRPEDARAAVEAGAVYGGVILAAGGSRTVDPSRVPTIFGETRLARCGVFVDEGLERVVGLAGELGLAVVQLHGDEAPSFVEDVREGTGVAVWKAIRPRSGEEFAVAADRYGGVVDGLLLDGWSPAGRGGTGARFPWSEVAAYRDRVGPDVRLIVAGGLNPRNVVEVTELLGPDVVDVSSGVERSPGIKDPEAIRDFVAAVRRERRGEGVE